MKTYGNAEYGRIAKDTFSRKAHKSDETAAEAFMLSESVGETCGKDSVLLMFEYKRPPVKSSSTGDNVIRYLHKSGRHTGILAPTGSWACRWDTVLSFLNIMRGSGHGHDDDLDNYPLDPGRVAPAWATDESARGQCYCYGSLHAVPKEVTANGRRQSCRQRVNL